MSKSRSVADLMGDDSQPFASSHFQFPNYSPTNDERSTMTLPHKKKNTAPAAIGSKSLMPGFSPSQVKAG